MGRIRIGAIVRRRGRPRRFGVGVAGRGNAGQWRGRRRARATCAYGVGGGHGDARGRASCMARPTDVPATSAAAALRFARPSAYRRGASPLRCAGRSPCRPRRGRPSPRRTAPSRGLCRPNRSAFHTFVRMNPNPPPRAPLWELVDVLASAAAAAPLPPALRALWALVAWTARQAADATPAGQPAPNQAASPHASAVPVDEPCAPSAPQPTPATPPYHEPVGPRGDPGAGTVAAPHEWQAARLRAALVARDAARVWEALGKSTPLQAAAPERPTRKRRSLAQRRKTPTEGVP